MKKMKKCVALILAVISIFSIMAPAASAAAKNPWDYSPTPTRAIYYKSPVMKGEDVKWLQQSLNILVNAGLSVDGSAGPATKAAIIKFQKANSLQTDGSCGPATRAKIVAALKSRGYTNQKNFLQSDSRWRYEKYNNSYLQDSGCGILSIVNAVYNSTGNFIEPTKVASWAHSAKYFNQASKGGGICNNAVFSKAAEKFGKEYGFKYIDSGSSLNSTVLKNHLKAGGTAVIHVPGHYMTLVDYNSSTGKYLVFDSAPGSGSNYNSSKRKGLTTAGGDWKTVAQLSTGNIKVDGFWMFGKR